MSRPEATTTGLRQNHVKKIKTINIHGEGELFSLKLIWLELSSITRGCHGSLFLVGKTVKQFMDPVRTAGANKLTAN